MNRYWNGVGFAWFCWKRQAKPDEWPPGLKYDCERGMITGAPTLPGDYILTFNKPLTAPTFIPSDHLFAIPVRIAPKPDSPEH